MHLPLPTPVPLPLILRMEGSDQILRARAQQPKRKVFDWISEPRPDNLTPFQQFIINVDWGKSSLGPMKSWPAQLRQMVLLVVADPSPAVVYWGDEATIVYNEAYTQLIGSKHPALQGQDPKIGFAEVWDHFESLLAKQREDGKTTVEENAFLLLHRHGFLEETYFSWKFVPIIGDEGWVVGSHATVVEVTREILSDRRLCTMQALSKHLSSARTIKDLWAGMIQGMEGADKDVPVAFIYSIADASEASIFSSKLTPPAIKSGASTSHLCILRASVGILGKHELVPLSLDLDSDQSYLSAGVREAMEKGKPVLMPIDGDKFLGGMEWRGFGIPSTQMIIHPIIPAHSRNVLAFLVIALNPRRPYDDDYRQFVTLLTEQVTTPQLSAIILRQEVERRQSLAKEEAIDRARLSRELNESEAKFARFAKRVPFGLASLTTDGLALSANELWQDLTQVELGSNSPEWEKILAKGEADLVYGAWERMVMEKKTVTMQTRMRRRWRAPDLDADGNAQFTDTHILLAMHPDLDEQGEVSTVMSCITDISGLKWSESQLRRRMDQAIEMKKQQERFIDMTSHEMRNPLSALIGCADEIITSLTDIRNSARSEAGVTRLVHLLDEAIEAADTIIYCAMHQKRIIDDILTLSRLDSHLLLVSPEPTQPVQLILTALKIFEAELKRAQIKFDFIPQDSLQTHQVEWTLLDPSRVLQVLINLVTNAIKFTRTEATRHITIYMGASLTKPSASNEFGVRYVKKSKSNPDETGRKEWGDGEVIYLSITVKDTGKGLTEKEINNLFHLFQQASPKTHVQYGGSGLGLFISRQLVEMQGGEIGVASMEGKGSTFQFYIKTRRTQPSTESPTKTDFQLLDRADALREACDSEVPGLRSGANLPILQPEPLLTTPPPKGFYVLVVEDNLVNQKVVSKQLRRAGYIVNVANHGEEALDFIRRSEYWVSDQSESEKEKLSVVLMDLEMPVMDGITCVKRIREFQATGRVRGHIPVIAMTANARKDQILRTLAAGMDDVSTKPYRIQEVLKKIEKLVEKHIIFPQGA